MKKIIAIVAALVLVLSVFAACGGEKAPEVTPYEGTFEELATKLYEANPVEFMVVPSMEIDLADPDALMMYTGLESAEGITEAAWSESMLGAQPYSMVLVRVAEGADMEAIKNAMFNGINTRKWICVDANELRVVSSADVIMLCMVGTDFASGLADKMVEAFAANVGELSGESLSRD